MPWGDFQDKKGPIQTFWVFLEENRSTLSSDLGSVRVIALTMATAISAPIPYFPTDQQALGFWESIARAQEAVGQVPPGFPKQLQSSLAWSAADLETQLLQHGVKLDGTDINALETALAAFKCEVAPTHIAYFDVVILT